MIAEIMVDCQYRRALEMGALWEARPDIAAKTLAAPTFDLVDVLKFGREAMETTVYVLVFSFLLGNGEVSSTQMSQAPLTLEGCVAASEKFHMVAATQKPEDVVGFTVYCVPINFRLPAKGEKDAGVQEIDQSRRG